MDDDTYYETLGVEPSASRDEVRAAYRSRVEELEAARGSKNVSESALQRNREETAKVRAAWNVLSDPFQRQRYDDQLAEVPDGTEALDDGDADDGEPGQEVALSGWRRLLAPPPPKQPANTNRNGNAGARTPPGRRPLPEPTIDVPRGTALADGRSRGMALLFDVSVLLLIYLAMQFTVPNLIQSDYKTTSDAITACNNVHSDSKPSQSDLKKCGVSGDTVKARQSAAQKQSDQLTAHNRTTTYVVLALILVVWLLYLVPSTAKTGRTFGMRRPGLRVLRVDGSPVGWYAAFVRFFIPVVVALAIPTIGPVIGLGLVLWGYRDRNKQGVHDKLAKTIVVMPQ
jgi:hypothetical protein